jgi:hypothetical protein
MPPVSGSLLVLGIGSVVLGLDAGAPGPPPVLGPPPLLPGWAGATPGPPPPPPALVSLGVGGLVVVGELELATGTLGLPLGASGVGGTGAGIVVLLPVDSVFPTVESESSPLDEQAISAIALPNTIRRNMFVSLFMSSGRGVLSIRCF